MEPRIQYAHTDDGVSIGFWTMGEGVPFVVTPFIPFSQASSSGDRLRMATAC